MKEQWRQQMRQKMADYRKAAPDVSWEELDKALANNKSKAKTVPMWMRKIAAAVVALVVVTGGYLALDRNHEELYRGDGFDHSVSSVNGITQFATPHSQRENRPHHEDGASLPNGEAASAQGAYSPVRSYKTRLLASHGDCPPVRSEVTTKPVDEDTVVVHTENKDNATDSRQAVNVTESRQEPSTTTPRQVINYPSDPQHQKASVSGSRLMAKVYLSNGLAGSNNYIRDNGYSGEFSNNTDKSQPTGQTQDYNNNSSNLTHHQPVRFGLSLRYRLDDKWSIESGLTYTRLRSDKKQGNSTNTEQTLSYVGIPVNANYLLWGNRHVNFYVSAGAMVEKMVKGRLETTYNGGKWEKDVSIHPLQFSINGGIGAEFNLTNQFSIYAEPGMGYYFDNGSSVPTYYQDTPFSFNLNLGLRLTLK